MRGHVVLQCLGGTQRRAIEFGRHAHLSAAFRRSAHRSSGPDSPTSITTSPGASASWFLRAPPSTHIVRAQLQRHLGTRHGWSAAIVTAEGGVLDECRSVLPVSCERGSRAGAGPQNAAFFSGLQSRGIVARIQCVDAVPCGNGQPLPNAWVAVYSAMVTVEDPSPPVVSPLSGSFHDAGWHRGTPAVAVSATDASGVRTLRVSAAARELASLALACDFNQMQPCPPPGRRRLRSHRATPGRDVPAHGARDRRGRSASGRRRTGRSELDRTAPGLADRADGAGHRQRDVRLHVDEPGPGAGGADRRCADGLRSGNGPTCKGANVQQLESASPVEHASISRTRPGTPISEGDDRRHRYVGVAVDAGRGHQSAGAAVVGSGAVGAVEDRARSGKGPRSHLRDNRRGASARITAGITRTRSGKPVVSGRATPRNGAWSVRLKLSPALRRSSAVYLTLSSAGKPASERRRSSAGSRAPLGQREHRSRVQHRIASQLAADGLALELRRLLAADGLADRAALDAAGARTRSTTVVVSRPFREAVTVILVPFSRRRPFRRETRTARVEPRPRRMPCVGSRGSR